MSGIPLIFVSEAVHYADSSLALETLRYVYDPSTEGSMAISRAHSSDAYAFVCLRCADDLGEKYVSEDAISEEWENVAVVAGNVGLEWKCDQCGKYINEMDENMDAYLYVHVMP